MPVKLREKIDKELDHLLAGKCGNIATYTQIQDSSVRMCFDPGNLNVVIIRECHKPPDNGRDHSSTKRNNGLHEAKKHLQIHLTKEASLLTTFNKYRGRFRFVRIPFGLKMSQDVFQL